MNVQDIILRAFAKKITRIQAAQIIAISPRQMPRWLRRYEEHGYDGLFDRRHGKSSPKRVPLEQVEQLLKLYQERYFDFNVKHFHEKLVADHAIKLSHTFVKTALQEAGLIKKPHKRRVHRKRRPRRPLPGMLLRIDATKHRWFQDGRFYDLIVILDDATSEIYYAQLVDEESTVTVLAALRVVIESKGIFCALYSDRASHSFYTPKGGGKVNREQLTQAGGAMKSPGIEMIAAYSPEARGRGERSSGAWQGRLPQELRLRGITTVEAANEFLQASYIREFNGKFTVRGEQSGSAFTKVKGQDLGLIFAIQHERVVGRDNTVSVDKRVLQIEKTEWRTSLAGCRVTVYEQADQSLSVGYGGHEVGRYSAAGKAIGKPTAKAVGKERKRKGTHPGLNSATEGI